MYFQQIFSSDQPRRIKWAGHVALMKERRGEVHTEFRWGNLRERDHLRHMCRWEDNINIDLKEVECGAWTGLTWLRIGTGSGVS